MTAAIRRSPQVEGRAALRGLGGALRFAVLAAVVWVLVNSYWPDEWTEPDEQTRQQITLVVSGVLVALAAAAAFALPRRHHDALEPVLVG